MEPTQERLLTVAAELFAEQGYAGTSMRKIARAAGITQAAIYHHFASKEQLYYAAVKFLQEEKTTRVTEQLATDLPAEERLKTLVQLLLELLDADPHFRHIYFRELLDGDEIRLCELATNVFADLSHVIEGLMRELAPHLDSHLTMMSVAGLVFHHLEARKLSPFMPGGKSEHSELPVLADHITTLLLKGVRTP